MTSTPATLWDLTALQDLRTHAVDRACAVTGRGMDPMEWAAAVTGVGYRDSCPPGSPT